MAAPVFLLAFLALISTSAIASDPRSLQDFCVADKMSNGKCSDHMFTENFF